MQRREERPREKRMNYTFDLDQVAELKEIAKALTRPTKPVTISMLLKEAIGDFLLKNDHRNGSPKSKSAAS